MKTWRAAGALLVAWIGAAFAACSSDQPAPSLPSPPDAGDQCGDLLKTCCNGTACNSGLKCLGGTCRTDNGNDGGPTADTGPKDTGPDAERPYQGSVVLSSETDFTGGGQVYLAAAFFEESAPPAPCTITVGTSCCYTPPPSGDAGPPPASLNAGIVQITDTTAASSPVSLSGPIYAISNPPTTGLTWQPLDVISVVDTQGGTKVKTFSGTVIAPPTLVGTVSSSAGPFDPNDASSTVIQKNKDFSITWGKDTSDAGVSGETVELVLASSGHVFVCEIDDATLNITIPHAALNPLTAGDSASVQLARRIKATALGDTVNVTLIASNSLNGTALIQ